MMPWLIHQLARILLLAAAMFWTVLWALVLGFVRSAIVRVLLEREQAQRAFGGQGLREVALAAVWGAGSFAPSYAAVATARTLFRKGGSLLCAMVFLFASTNLSAEFLLILWLLMGWRVLLLELAGGLVFIAVLSLFLRAAWPVAWSEAARDHHESGHGRPGDNPIVLEGNTLRQKAVSLRNWAAVADVFLANWRRVWKELLLGFVLAGALAVFVPHRWWQALAVSHVPAVVWTAEHALLGPLVAAVSCVPSPGNLPLARVLLYEHLGVGGVLAFMYADLLALPLVLMYRRHFGNRAAAFLTAALWLSAATAGVASKGISDAMHLVPRVTPPPSLVASVSGDWRWPTLPNVVALLASGALIVVRLRYGRRPGLDSKTGPG